VQNLRLDYKIFPEFRTVALFICNKSETPFIYTNVKCKLNPRL